MTLFLHQPDSCPTAPSDAAPRRRACPCGREIRDGVDDALIDALAHLGTGIVILDRRARVLFASPPARRLLAARGLVSSRDGTLRTGSQRETAELHRLVAQSGRHSIRALARRRSMLIGAEGIDPVLACLVPLAGDPEADDVDGDEQADAPAAALLLTAGDRALPTVTDLQLRFGLTPAEACCARQVLRCDGLAAYARRAGISEATARTHLKHVFEKTGTRRQAQLVRLLLAETPSLSAFDEPGESDRDDDA